MLFIGLQELPKATKMVISSYGTLCQILHLPSYSVGIADYSETPRASSRSLSIENVFSNAWPPAFVFHAARLLIAWNLLQHFSFLDGAEEVVGTFQILALEQARGVHLVGGMVNVCLSSSWQYIIPRRSFRPAVLHVSLHHKCAVPPR